MRNKQFALRLVVVLLAIALLLSCVPAKGSGRGGGGGRGSGRGGSRGGSRGGGRGGSGRGAAIFGGSSNHHHHSSGSSLLELDRRLFDYMLVVVGDKKLIKWNSIVSEYARMEEWGNGGDSTIVRDSLLGLI
ncbi:hypothetical protein ACFE04_029109 [Oxalis oulophora]